MVYGDMLSFFSEQNRNFEYFTMTPLDTSSYTKRQKLGTVRGVLQYMKKGELERENDALADVNVPSFWTRRSLKVGNYFISNGEEIYRIKNPSDWTFEGGFNVYVLESVIGNTDEQEPFEDVDLGQDDYE